MTGILPLANKLAELVREPPMPRLNYVTTQPRRIDLGAFTEQERKWIEEAAAKEKDHD
jgi:hypothetical protein